MDAEAARRRIVNFIREYVRKSGARGVVLPMSGGLDSSLTVALCAMAIGGENVIGITFRDDITPKIDIDNAKEVARMFGIKFVTCDITNLLDATLKVIPVCDPRDALSKGNLKVRLRMLVSYYYANRLNLLVVGTTNKSELLTGYFTKYGDGAVDIEPLGDIYKTQVIQLARHVGIPKPILEKPPSAGLWPGQLDEEELGISYEILDLILYGLERNMSADEIAKALVIEKSDVKRIQERCLKNRHKRYPPPVPKMTES